MTYFATYKGKPDPRIKTPCNITPYRNYCAYQRTDHNSRTSKMKNTAKTKLPEIARNPVPPGKAPTPAIGTQNATVLRDGVVSLRMTHTPEYIVITRR